MSDGHTFSLISMSSSASRSMLYDVRDEGKFDGIATYNPLGGSTAVGVEAEPAFKSRISSEPPVA
jgi:hypothetical protein